ncbi:hypothetical protein B0T17DRAFT_524993 [Bombardia bombarda]|uniref:DNA-binding protein RAP1 n=1 Tax=Bombardia bombarda TaxID=252184 RepID=A0AA40C9J5_9PEZI|nr:hypothetical protein B0T17DRAFT_524993 [Bombardia bombarda]
MPPIIAYEGGDGNYEGTLFGGLKFFIARQVPSRDSLVELTKNNGGKIVLLEKYADLKIADHARKNVPPQSVSWKYIEDCVKKGELLNSEEYKIAHAAEPRPVGATQAIKGTRNPFTTGDDQTLIRWVLRHERNGASVKGNAIYQSLAEKHPNHTWQSWRDRWVKNYDTIPRDSLPNIGESPPPSPPRPKDTRQPSPAAPGSPTLSARRAAAPPPTQTTRTTKGRVPFTEEDDKLLNKHVHELIRAGYQESGNKIYAWMEEEYPHHTMHSWRDRWLRHLSLRKTPAPEPSRPSSVVGSAVRPLSNASPPTRSSSAQNDLSTIPPRKAEPRVPRKTKSPEINTNTRHTARLNTQMPENATSVRLRKIRSVKTIQRVWRGYRTRRDLSIVKLQTSARGFIARRYWNAKAPSLEENDTHSRQDDDEVNGEPWDIAFENPERERVPRTIVSAPKTLTEKENFYADLRGYQEELGSVPISWVEINGIAHDMWELWCVVQEQEMASGFRNWEEIAERLGYDWIKDPDMTNQLKEAWDTHLEQFKRLRERFDDMSQDSFPEDDDDDNPSIASTMRLDEEQAFAPSPPVGNASTTSAVPLDMEQAFVSSPPVRNLKRSAREEVWSDAILETARKRPRYNATDEILSTPEKRPDRVVSPTSKTSNSPQMPRSSPQKLPQLPQPTKIAEPETQDFAFDQVVEEMDDDILVSPSQQLRSELNQAQTEAREPEPVVASNIQRQETPPVSDSSSDAFESPSRMIIMPKTRKRSPAAHSAAVLKAASKGHQRILPPAWSRPAQPNSEPETTLRQPPTSFNSIAFAQRQMPPPPAGTMPPLHRRPTETASSSSNHRNTRERHVSAPVATVPTATRTPTAAKSTRRLMHSRPPLVSSTAPSTNTRPRSAVTRESTSLPDRFISLGYDAHLVSKGLRATCLNPGLAGVVIESLKRGKGVPYMMRGVWTTRDDVGLMIIGRIDWDRKARTQEEVARRERAMEERRRLVEKHGEEGLRQRKEFLQAYERA